MSSKRRVRRSSCGVKVPYSTRDAARAAASSLRARKPGYRGFAYRCDFGAHWHVGRSPKARTSR